MVDKEQDGQRHKAGIDGFGVCSMQVHVVSVWGTVVYIQ